MLIKTNKEKSRHFINKSLGSITRNKKQLKWFCLYNSMVEPKLIFQNSNQNLRSRGAMKTELASTTND